MQAKKEFEVEEFRTILSEYREERAKMEAMGKEEREDYEAEKDQLKEIFRTEEQKHFPLIIKCASAGTLETLIT